MKTLAKTPKLLPWLARKAGIDDVRAAALWREAERWAARQAPDGSPVYYKLAVDRLLHLVAEESLREDAASFGWRPWARGQARLWSLAMRAMDEASALNARGWAIFEALARQRRHLLG